MAGGGIGIRAWGRFGAGGGIVTAGDLPADAHIGRTALVVNDLDELTAFYRDVVGLPVLDRTEPTVTLGAGGDALLVLTEEPSASQRARSGAGLYHNAFRVPDRGALGDALLRIRDNWHLGGASDHLVSEALYLTDPEGNGVEIYRDRPRDDWPTTDDGHVQMDTVALDLDDLQSESAGMDGAPAGTDVGHVHLEVTNLGAAREFYVDTLGMNVRQTWGGAALFVAAGDYHHHVGLNTWHHRSTPRNGRGLDWFEVVVPDQQTLEAVRERFENADVAVETGAAGVGGTEGTDGGVGGADGRDAGVAAEGGAEAGGEVEGAGASAEPGTGDGGFVVRDPDGIEVHVRRA